MKNDWLFRGIHKTYPSEQPLHVLREGWPFSIDEGRNWSVSWSSVPESLHTTSTSWAYLGRLRRRWIPSGMCSLIQESDRTSSATHRNQLIGFIFQSFNLDQLQECDGEGRLCRSITVVRDRTKTQQTGHGISLWKGGTGTAIGSISSMQMPRRNSDRVCHSPKWWYQNPKIPAGGWALPSPRLEDDPGWTMRHV